MRVYGQQACFICQRDYTALGGKHLVRAEDEAEIYLDGECFQAVDSLARARGITRWEAVVEKMDRIRNLLLGGGVYATKTVIEEDEFSGGERDGD